MCTQKKLRNSFWLFQVSLSKDYKFVKFNRFLNHIFAKVLSLFDFNFWMSQPNKIDVVQPFKAVNENN